MQLAAKQRNTVASWLRAIIQTLSRWRLRVVEWLKRYAEMVAKSGVYKASALTPLLWLNLLVTVPCIIASFQLTTAFRWAPFVLACIIVLYTLVAYTLLVRIDPRLVQSEKFQREMRALDIVAERGGQVAINPVNLPLSQNPERALQPFEGRPSDSEVKK